MLSILKRKISKNKGLKRNIINRRIKNE